MRPLFLAALSVEGITPKLIWTKRIATGDVLTAQDWVNGHTLTRAQMNSPMVAQLLGKVHNSVLLRRMLKKVGGSPQTPRQLFDQVASTCPHRCASTRWSRRQSRPCRSCRARRQCASATVT